MHALIVAAAALLLGAPPAAPAAAKVDGKTAFEQLKRLEGNWKTEGAEPTYLSLRVVAAGNAVLETTTGSDKTKILIATVYSLDGGELVMTHYSSQGTQPHMKLKAFEGGKDLRFEATSVGNLTHPRQAQMRSVLFKVTSPGQLTQEWESLEAGRANKTVLTFTREYLDTLK